MEINYYLIEKKKKEYKSTVENVFEIEKLFSGVLYW